MFNWQMISFQDPATFIMKYLIYFHDISMMILVLITSLILYIILILKMNKLSNLSIMHGQTIELMWTIMPMFILVFLAIPSIQILYITEEMYSPNLTIKSIGHQWYWSYEYADFNNINFDSFMMNEINLNTFRLLDVDNNMIIPFNLPIRMIISSDDVIHSWTVPSLGIKLDAIPGRLNQTYFMTIRAGLFFGQCSEICGVNHSFMPICVESTNPQNFINWIKNMMN